MSSVLYLVSTAVMMVLMLRGAAQLIDVRAAVRRRRVPWAAVVLVGLAVAGLVLQYTWSGAMALFDDDPARAGWWRPLTAVFLQNGGLAGDAWNLVTLALAAAAAGIVWGQPLTLGIFLAGTVLPGWLDQLVGHGTVSHDPRNFVGSSGATYFLAATVAAVLLVRGGTMPNRLLAVSAPVLGLIVFFTLDNAHGLVTAEGFVLGLILVAVRLAKPIARPTAATVAPAK